jgi:release factor glutamine methyltransferase
VKEVSPAAEAGGTGAASPRVLLDYLRLAADFLGAKGIDSCRLDAELLLADVLDLDRVGLYTAYDRPLAAHEVDGYRRLVRRRAAREPVAYILGHREFWSIKLKVDRRVLIPRPETEAVVETARDLVRGTVNSGSEAGPLLADIGTGSGAIAVALAGEIAEARVVATDISEAALEVARANVAAAGLEQRVELARGDLVAPLKGRGPFDLVVSNPPYLGSGDWRELEPEISRWEPETALKAGDDGLALTARLIDAAPACLGPDGWLVVEVGSGSARVREMLDGAGWRDLEVTRDLAGIERVMAARRPL